jgi:hypothetical protein
MFKKNFKLMLDKLGTVKDGIFVLYICVWFYCMNSCIVYAKLMLFFENNVIF